MKFPAVVSPKDPRTAGLLQVALCASLACFGPQIRAAVAPVGVNVLPGPPILYEAPPRAPQFENVGIWQAEPLLISGAAAYRNGEFLYQDYLYDDRGATTNGNAGSTSLARSGRYTYPTNVASYFENLADIVEVRLKLTPTDTAFRVTFNSMSSPTLVGTTIGLGGTAGVLMTVPFGANAVQPAEIFMTMHGNVAVVTEAISGNVLASLPVVADTDRRQIEVRLPFSLYDPRGRALRVSAAAGLWDVVNDRYLIPTTTATATRPGGAGNNTPNPPAFFNVGFRFTEPNPSLSTLTRWRDGRQGSVLAATVTVNGVQTHNLSEFGATVDFVKLASGVDDDMSGQTGGIPTSGFINRIYSSRFEVVQGVGSPAAPQQSGFARSVGCTPTSPVAPGGQSCRPEFSGRLQPYSLYVPVKQPPATGYGLISDLHGGGDNYQRNPPVTIERDISLGERGTGSLVFSAQGRGQVYWWYGQTGSDIFEVVADIGRHYKVDPEQLVASGISHGGYATWKLSTMFPDLYAVAMPHVPCPSAGGSYNGSNAPGGINSFIFPMLRNLRYVPVIESAGESDTTCNWLGALGNQAIRAQLDALSYEFEFWSFVGAGHIFAVPACANVVADLPLAPSPKPCGFSFVPDYLDKLFGVGQPLKRRVVNPPRVTYTTSNDWNEPLSGFTGDHAYWVSGVTIRDTKVSNYGNLDVFSYGIGLADRLANPTVKTSGSDYSLAQNMFHSYNIWSKTLNPAAPIAQENRLDVTATNISKVVIDPIRARIDCNAVVNVTSDGPISVVIHGCLKGDYNLDDAVDCKDVAAAKLAFGAQAGDARYDPRLDMDNNGVIDARDAIAVHQARTTLACN